MVDPHEYKIKASQMSGYRTVAGWPTPEELAAMFPTAPGFGETVRMKIAKPTVTQMRLCTIDLSGAGYECMIKHPDGATVAIYNEGDRVMFDGENLDLYRLHIYGPVGLKAHDDKVSQKAFTRGALIGAAITALWAAIGWMVGAI